MPDIVTYEVDWPNQRAAREQMLAQLMAEAASVPNRQGCRWLRDNLLRARIAQTGDYRKEFREKLANASAQTMHNVEHAIASYDWSIGFFRGVRDTSVDIVLVGAVFLTGPEALMVAGGGALLRGAYG
jgi:hypothetical protein